MMELQATVVLPDTLDMYCLDVQLTIPLEKNHNIQF